MKQFLLFIFINLVLNLNAQDKGSFTFEVEANRIHYNQMESLNSFLRDTTDVNTSIWFGNDYINDTLVKSSIYGVSLSYQPLNFIDFGVYSRYQSNKFERRFELAGLTSGDPNFNPEYVIARNVQIVQTTSFSVGCLTNVYLNKLFHFDKHSSDFLQNFQLAIGLKGGLSFNRFEVKNGSYGVQLMTFNGNQNIEALGSYMNQTDFRSTSFNGVAELKIGYRIINSQLFSMIGIKAGYQLSGSSIPKDKTERTYNFASNKEELKLNFSGVYYGVYLTIGK